MNPLRRDTEPLPTLAFGLRALSESTGMSVNFWRQEIAKGNVRSTRLGRRVLISADEARRYLEANTR